ncbi:pre-mRNA cleavage and polyadenylation factor (CPF) complex subunit, partial [Kickxella alabastrina]
MSGPPPPPPSMHQRPHPPSAQQQHYQQQQQNHPGQHGNVRFPQQMRPQQMQQGMNMGYAQQNRPPMGMQGQQMGGMRPQGMYQQRPMQHGMNPQQQQGHYMQQQQQQRFQHQGGGRGGHMPNMAGHQPNMTMQRPNRFNAQFDGGNRPPQKQKQRRTIDYYGATLRGLELRSGGAHVSLKYLPTDPSYSVDVFPPTFVPDEPETSVATRFVHSSSNKVRYPINVIRWTPEGRRLITGSSSGELTLWNGLTFNFETILQAHDNPIRSMEWSHDSQWMISGDHGGII